MTVDLASVQIRLNSIADYLSELKLLDGFSSDEILGDVYKYRATERLLEIIIQTSLDISRHLLKEIYQLEPKTNSDVFIASISVGILPEELGIKLSKAAKFRNVLAHQYTKIEPQKVIENIQPVLRDYPIYIDLINNYLDSLEVEDVES